MITADLTPSLVERRGKYLQGQHGQKASTNGDSSALEGACSVAVVGWAWLDRSAGISISIDVYFQNDSI
jgi:hypothetical protein